MAIEAKKMGDRAYEGFVILPSLLVALVGTVYGMVNLMESGVDAFHGDLRGAGENFLQAYIAAFAAAAVGKSAVDASAARRAK